MSSNPRSLVALTLLLVVGAGCFGLVDDGGPARPAVDGDAAVESYESIDGVHAVVETTITHGNTTEHRASEVWLRPATGAVREEIREPASREGNVVVANGSQLWVYNESRAVVRTQSYERGQGDAVRMDTFLRQVFDAVAASDDETVASPPTVGMGPAPSVPVDGETGAEVRNATTRVENYTATYEGRETVAGRETHVVALAPTGDVPTVASDLRIRYYLDAERYFPVKVAQSMTVNGEEFRIVTEYSDVEFDADVPDSRFRFDPPEEASVVDLDESQETFETRAAAAANVSMTIPDPDVPAGYELYRVGLLRGEITTVTVFYRNDAGNVLYVSKHSEPRSTGSAEGVTVDVDGTEGRYVATDSLGSVVWACAGDRQYAVVSVDGSLSRSTLVAVARSTGCR
ncbi:LolA family protein [Haloarchaeobius baliensis]|uniref:LolA family protein n=1 Tax=Haloarchaeobius baliensis TaxID=1670458 RepID=UPI003F880850